MTVHIPKFSTRPPSLHIQALQKVSLNSKLPVRHGRSKKVVAG